VKEGNLKKNLKLLFFKKKGIKKSLFLKKKLLLNTKNLLKELKETKDQKTLSKNNKNVLSFSK
jgi:hypothetical protein